MGTSSDTHTHTHPHITIATTLCCTYAPSTVQLLKTYNTPNTAPRIDYRSARRGAKQQRNASPSFHSCAGANRPTDAGQQSPRGGDRRRPRYWPAHQLSIPRFESSHLIEVVQYFHAAIFRFHISSPCNCHEHYSDTFICH